MIYGAINLPDMPHSLDAISDYLSHVCDGATLRDLSMRTGVSPSTVMRRARAIEDARECPQWDDIFSRFEAAAVQSSLAAAGPDALVRAVGADPDGLIDRLASRRGLLSPGAFLVADVGFPYAVLSGVPDSLGGRFVYADLLAFVVFGWVIPHRAFSGAMMAWNLAPAGVAALARGGFAPHVRSACLDPDHALELSNPMFDAGVDFGRNARRAVDCPRAATAVDAARAILPAPSFDLLVSLFSDGRTIADAAARAGVRRAWVSVCLPLALSALVALDERASA